MQKIIYIFLVGLFICNCVETHVKQEKDLTGRINEYYSSWGKLNLGKMWGLLSSSIQEGYGDKENFLATWKEFNIRVKAYRILHIRISNANAHVEMEVRVTDNEKETHVCFDDWKVENGRWVLDKSGKIEEDKERRRLITGAEG